MEEADSPKQGVNPINGIEAWSDVTRKEDKAYSLYYIRENGKTLEDWHEKPKQKAHIHVPGFGKASALSGKEVEFGVLNKCTQVSGLPATPYSVMT